MVWWITAHRLRLDALCGFRSPKTARLRYLFALGSSELRNRRRRWRKYAHCWKARMRLKAVCVCVDSERRKSPLAAIRGAAEILREGPPADVVTRFTENILAQNTRMALVKPCCASAAENDRISLSAPVAADELFTQLSEARSAFSWRAKRSRFTLRPSSLVVVADASFWRRRWAMC